MKAEYLGNTKLAWAAGGVSSVAKHCKNQETRTRGLFFDRLKRTYVLLLFLASVLNNSHFFERTPETCFQGIWLLIAVICGKVFKNTKGQLLSRDNQRHFLQPAAPKYKLCAGAFYCLRRLLSAGEGINFFGELRTPPVWPGFSPGPNCYLHLLVNLLFNENKLEGIFDLQLLSA